MATKEIYLVIQPSPSADVVTARVRTAPAGTIFKLDLPYDDIPIDNQQEFKIPISTLSSMANADDNFVFWVSPVDDADNEGPPMEAERHVDFLMPEPFASIAFEVV